PPGAEPAGAADAEHRGRIPAVMTDDAPISRTARELNEVIRYTAGSVFRAPAPLPADGRATCAQEVEELYAELAEKDVVVRGSYEVSGLRADADLMIWWHAETAEA